jgi:hypothetical protein
LRLAAVLGAVATFALVGYGLNKPADEGISARVALQEVPSDDGRMVNATVRLDPPDAADDAEFFNVTAWQGGGFHLDALDEVRPGVYRTSEPAPVYGTWKTLIRLHEGNSLIAVPVYLPEDPAIPAAGVPAKSGFTREFVADHEILQREQKSAAAWLTGAAYLAVFAMTMGFLILLAWGLHRLAMAGAAEPHPGGAPAPREPARLGRPVPSAG